MAKKYADPQDYQIHISWNDKTVIYADGWKEGWLKNTDAVSSQSELINPDGISALGHYWGMVSNREKKFAQERMIKEYEKNDSDDIYTSDCYRNSFNLGVV